MQNIELLKKHGFEFNKRFGQNFIFDTNLLRSIAQDANLTKSSNVLEIGPGAGTLTKVLSDYAGQVISYEIDKNLKEVLNENLKDCGNVKIIFEDIMKANIIDIENSFAGNYTIVANLPYYITTPILFKFIEESKKCDAIIVMVQKEMGERIVAKAGTKDYGTISVSLNYRSDVSITRIVKRNMFTPPPNVDSCIVKIVFNPNKYKINNETLLNNIIKYAFAMRRKTLLNNLKGKFNLLQEELIEVLNEMGKDVNVRGETFNTDEFVMLSNLINDKVTKKVNL